MTNRLEDKIAVVTGASRGIGRATALALAKEGAHVVVTARSQDELDDLAREVKSFGVQSLAVAADASTVEGVELLRAAAFDTFQQVDILVNNVGVAKYTSLLDLTVEDYDWMMNTNVRSNFLVTKAFLPQMLEREGGAIIFVGSVAGLMGFPNETVYCASKHAQTGFARALDGEVREKGIKVSVIAPGGVNTHLALGTGRSADDPDLKTYLDAEDVAEAVVFAATQGPKSRAFLVGMRPMVEPLY